MVDNFMLGYWRLELSFDLDDTACPFVTCVELKKKKASEMWSHVN